MSTAQTNRMGQMEFAKVTVPDLTPALEIPPPYELLTTGEDIQPGDLKLYFHNPSRAQQGWQPVEDFEIGQKVPSAGIAYIRCRVPEGYQLVTGDGPTQDVQHWNGTTWAPGRGQLMIVPKTDTENSTQTQSEPHIPQFHRKLAAGETLRRGDLLWRPDRKAWDPIDENLHGLTTPIPTLPGSTFCRPIATDAKIWYVCPATGKTNNTGGPLDPWPSLDVAIEQITHIFTQAGKTPYGIIANMTGEPLAVYDLPEPPDPKALTTTLHPKHDDLTKTHRTQPAPQPHNPTHNPAPQQDPSENNPANPDKSPQNPSETKNTILPPENPPPEPPMPQSTPQNPLPADQLAALQSAVLDAVLDKLVSALQSLRSLPRDNP